MSDTIVARSPLAVEVVPSPGTTRRSGIVVNFSAPAPPFRHYPPVVLRPGDPTGLPIASDTTDENGRLALQLQLGTMAGVTYLRIDVPALGLRDSIRTAVSPGLPRRLSGAPADTTVLTGQSYRLRTLAAYDQMDNLIPDLPTTRTLHSCISVQGDLVTALGPCRGTVELVAGAERGWLYVSVPPDFQYSTVTGAGVTIHRASGSVLQVIPIPPSIYFPWSSEWSPDGKTFVFDGRGPLYAVDPGGALRELTDPAYYAIYPSFTRDGAWVYYARQTPPTWEIRRVQLDGSRDSLITPAGGIHPYPAPSRDGRWVTFLDEGGLRLYEVATGVSTLLGTYGPAAWSPLADEMAVWGANGAVIILRPDGTELREVPSIGPLGAPYKFSRDGLWLIGHLGPQGIGFFGLQTGAEIPLFDPRFGAAPAWRP